MQISVCNDQIYTERKGEFTGLQELFFGSSFSDSNSRNCPTEEKNSISGKEDSYSNTRDDSQENSKDIIKDSQVKACLDGDQGVCFEYLQSTKVFDPKHLPFEDNGIMYYFQDDPVLYKKMKK